MKKKILFLFLIISYSSISQDLKISEMIKLLEMSLDDSDSWSIKNGYTPNTTIDSKDSNCKYYFSYRNIKITTNDICFYKCIYDGYLPNFSFRTRSNSLYAKFKDELNELGFKFCEIVSDDKGKLIFYTKKIDEKVYELTLGTTIYDTFNLFEVALKIR